MTRAIPRISTAEAVIHGVLKLRFLDGYEGVVDLRPLIDRGKIFAPLRDPGRFAEVSVGEYGHSIGWVGDDGSEIDLGAGNLRLKAESQAQLFKAVANARW
jgi:Protein of unknown function (DUF2442)